MDFTLMIDSILPILEGAQRTVELVVLSLALGFTMAVMVAVIRRSRITWASRLMNMYVFAIRGTPLLVQLFLIYYGLGQFAWIRESVLWPVLRNPFWCAIIALTVNTTAYGSEIIRGGLESVPWGEVEAGRSIGMSGLLLFRRIIFPVAIRQALPAYGNEVILMVKATSLASTITIMEMTGVANVIMAENYRPLEVFIVAGSFYLLINFILTRIVQAIEWHLSGHLRPTR
ncbi:nopaline transport system permease protein NocM [Desulfosarcina alkanivorans]|jgi:octopine/nopaline transport system permease protein|uniref:Nopaline transport system permease protein NocM n=1 Tax=Desulfosarcina alkanivorans TaxID=571177 RepID=A0A5K7YZA5_9BACT|nr:ABC transporter permease [Desulfosarcina alkanivorans]BBO72521.1 nopaline transport system permease protein NocM [Desulfosarcina alkanivorans]